MSDRLPATPEIRAGALRFAFLEAGSGPLALCMHGFPDSAYTWRHLLPVLADAGFHAVAPFMRGYAPSDLTADGCYTVAALVYDATAIHEALGGDEDSVLIGHDWGAEAAYGAAAFAPQQWRRLVTLAVPPAALDRVLFADYEQLKRFFYIFGALIPRWDESVSANDMAMLDRLWADWSPGYDASTELSFVKRCLRHPANLTAALDYYRAAYGPMSVPTGKYKDEQESLSRPAPQPTLYLHGDRDGCIALDLVRDATRSLSPGSQMSVVQGVGHFPHLEKPAVVNAQIISWLTR